MLLGARQFFERRGAPTPPLPYDAEVMWLEGTGTQWIDTGISLKSDMIVSCRFASTVITTGSLNYILGQFTASRQQFCVATYSDFRAAILGNTASLGAPADTLWHDVKVCSAFPRYAELDGVRRSFSTTATPSPTITSTLFAIRPSNGTVAQNNIGSCKIASFSVRDTSTNKLLLDLIPVRKNGVGYMYDRVSGQLLGNSGTGDFVLGQDKS